MPIVAALFEQTSVRQAFLRPLRVSLLRSTPSPRCGPSFAAGQYGRLHSRVVCAVRPPEQSQHASRAEISAKSPHTHIPTADTSLHLSPTSTLFVLNFITVLWGTQHAVMKSTLEALSPQALNLLRFSLASLLALPSLPLPTPANRSIYKTGLELSFYLFLGYALQAQSLLTTSASRSGFLLYLNVKFVPILGRFLYGRSISALTWASAAMALTGTVLLTWDGTPPNTGDLGSVAAALASAMFILRLESAAKLPADSVNSVALLGVSVLCGAWCLASPPSQLLPGNGTELSAILYLGIVTTALSNYLQTVAQRYISPERAAVVFALDPVYGALFASVWLGEHIGTQGIIGAAVIVFAAMISNWEVIARKKRSGGDTT
ncbi:unnamed protein product [Agarophyton chilense]|eukprot:gb/GEZJ01002523.1/.p1 GENE.gb/GEZJ01002523.1/~~gb/GEZJ01002523.1/.p1  ORF type:complete len:377 (-),score=33.77 gb/GEZJ01002523.1/:658-1788(-)